MYRFQISTPAKIVGFDLSKILCFQTFTSNVVVSQSECHPEVIMDIWVFESLVCISVPSWEDKVISSPPRLNLIERQSSIIEH